MLEQEIKKEIIKTVTYFDLFNYPLTSVEIWQHIAIKCEYADVLSCLNDIKYIDNNKGFYFLKNRESNITIKNSRYNITHKKYKRALRVTKIFRLIPWVKLITIANLIGSHNLKKEGDIDFFIVTEKNKLWLTRFFCVGIIKILKLRPTAKTATDKICLSFLIDETNLNLEPFLLNQSASNKDRYFTYWLSGLYPIYNKDNTYNKLINSNNWFKDYLPNWKPQTNIYHRDVSEIKNKLYNKYVAIFLNIFNTISKKIQRSVMNKNIIKQMNKGTNVVISEHVFKLHTDDRRQKYFTTYLNVLKYISTF